MSELIERILEWAKFNPKFDTSFVDSVSEWIGEHEITSAQEDALQIFIVDGRLINGGVRTINEDLIFLIFRSKSKNIRKLF
jgi:hypothetical protein